MSELRKKTCYELSTPDTNFVKAENSDFEAHSSACDFYISQVEEAYGRYTQIQQSNTPPEEKTRQIRDLYAKLNQTRDQIYSQMDVVPIVVANSVANVGDSASPREKRATNPIVKYTDESPDTFTTPKSTKTKGKAKPVIVEPNDDDAFSPVNAAKDYSDMPALEATGDPETQRTQYVNDVMNDPNNYLNSVDGGSLKNKKRKTIKMNIRRGLKKTIKKR
jgi:hypothetical protein